MQSNFEISNHTFYSTLDSYFEGLSPAQFGCDFKNCKNTFNKKNDYQNLKPIPGVIIRNVALAHSQNDMRQNPALAKNNRPPKRCYEPIIYSLIIKHI